MFIRVVPSILFGLILSISTYASGDIYIFTHGYGENKTEAKNQSKQELAKRIYSKVRTSEYMHTIKKNDDSSVSYEHHSSIDTIPVVLKDSELDSVDCSSTPCKYTFRIHKESWLSEILLRIENNHSKIAIYIDTITSNWQGFQRVSEVTSLLKSTEYDLFTLAFLDSEKSLELITKQHYLEQQLFKLAHKFSITFKAANDHFSNQATGLLSKKANPSSSPNFNVYVKSSLRKGKKGNLFVARQTLSLQVFDTRNPGTQITHNEISEMATSSLSSEHAKELAQSKILATLETQPISSIIN